MKIIYSPEAEHMIPKIWQWTSEFYGGDHADQYLAELRQAIDALVDKPLRGKPVAGKSDLRYLTMRRKNARHGHIAVYRVKDGIIEIAHIFHTAQNWLERVSKKQ